jgi:hypothetical protein
MPVTNALERLNKEVKRRADVVGIFPNEAGIAQLIGAVVLEQNDEWLLQLPLHADRGDGRTRTARARHRVGQTSTTGRLTDGHGKLHPDLHHLQGRDRYSSSVAHPAPSPPMRPCANSPPQ